jgi:hypothetical protein
MTTTPTPPTLTADVTRERGLPTTFTGVYLVLWALTLASALVFGLFPFDAIANVWVGSRLQLEPHAFPTPGGALATCVHNVIVAGWPLLFVALRLHRDGWQRDFGTALLKAFLIVNATLVGAASAAGGERLLPYVIQLPVEWAAVALSAAGWLVACKRGIHTNRLALITAAFVVLASVAAVLETYAVPHL